VDNIPAQKHSDNEIKPADVRLSIEKPWKKITSSNSRGGMLQDIMKYVHKPILGDTQ